MCLMMPGRVVAVAGGTCEVETGGRTDRASMMLEPDLAVGDRVLVNSGTVVRKLDEEDAPLLDTALPEFERIMIEAALEATGGKKHEAAQRLGWGRNTLTRKMQALEMES